MKGHNNSIRAQKLRKLQELKAEGVPAYGYKFERTHKAAQVISEFDYLKTDEFADEEIRLCGRIMNQRFTWTFIDIADDSGTVQLVCDKSKLSKDTLRQLRLLDRGDIIGVKGRAMRTKNGPPSVCVESWELLAKSLQALPESAAALSDVEQRYRNRHLDLLFNEEARAMLLKRSKAITTLRGFLDGRGFLEVETPILQVQAGGAEAKPFITHHNSLDIEMQMRISPEFYLKRLLIGGIERVYEIGKNFRNEGISARHNPEFTSIELFQAYSDYYELMDLTESMLRHIAVSVCGGGKINYQGVELDFEQPFKRITMTDAIENVLGIDVDSVESFEELKDIANALGVRLSDEDLRGEIVNAIFEQKVEQTLIQPTFLMEQPEEVSTLQAPHRSRTGYAERFELYIFGREVAHGCSELIDPRLQRSRFEAQTRKRANGHEEMPALDAEFVMAMEYGMPPMMGLGIGIDRFVMFLCNAPSIRDVIAFPTMKPLPRVAEMGSHLADTDIREVG
ncbi:MAG: lysine--tRNA ligase [Candidatus Obscuribacterales bacterium]|nr:lysine--tRNA ligase [Candidatus Obscuribacterales bacterium]